MPEKGDRMPIRKRKQHKAPVTHKAYRFLALSDEAQKLMFAKTFGCVRYLYNRMLNDKAKCYEYFGETLTLTPAWYKHLSCCRWLSEVDSLALANVQLNLNTAYKNFYDGRSRFPKYKKKSDHYDSYTTNVVGANIKVRSFGKYMYLTLPKILGEVRIRQHRQIKSGGLLKSVTVSREPNGKFYVSLLYEFPYVKQNHVIDPDKALGLDMSMPYFYIDSDGNIVEPPHSYRKMEGKLAKEQRKLSHMVKGSSNYRKQCLKVAKLHAKAKHQRNDFLHKASRRLVETYDIIGIEDLNMRDMSRSLNYGKSIADKGWGAFVNMLLYKAEVLGKKVIKVSKWFPSSQMCHECGCLSKLTKDLSVKEWECPHCGAHLVRDHNAAINIRDEAVRIYCTC